MRAELARRTLLDFVVATRPNYQVNWHHRLICEYLDRFISGAITRLLIETPPRHGKSELVSRCLPAYVLGRNPDASLIATSYSADLAQAMGRDVQRIIESNSYSRIFPHTKLSTSNARTEAGTWVRKSDVFEVVGRQGVYKCAGVGGGVTGMGANYCIIDDPIKNQQEADSPTYREKIWDWYTSTLYTRLHGEPQGILLTLTRWHQDDLAGRLLAKAKSDPEADQWTVLKLEAIKESAPNDIDPRKEGEPLWPSRYGHARLSKIKASTSNRVWSSLYQQRPSPEEGGLLKRWWWRFWYPRDSHQVPPKVSVRLESGHFVECPQVELPVDLMSHAQSWDMAFKDTKDSAFVVGQVWARHQADAFLLDQVRDKMDFPRSVAAVQGLSRKWPQTLAKLVEDKANGPAIIATLGRSIPGLVAVEPQGGKEARANAASPIVNAGNVYLPHPSLAPWVQEFIDECAAFPNGEYADQVDTATQFLIWSYGDSTDVTKMLATW